MTGDDGRVSPCPDDERLGAFLDGRLRAAGREEVERHVAGCPSCLDVLAAGLGAAWVPEAHVAAVTGPSKTRPARFSWRRLSWAAIVAVALAGLALVAARRPVPGLGAAVARVASRWFDVDVRIQGIRGRLGPSGTFVVGLRGLRFEHGKDRFAVDEIEATVALASLVAGDSSLRRLVLVRPRFQVAWPSLAALDTDDRARAALRAIARIDVVDGIIEFRDAAPESPEIEGIIGGMTLHAGEGRIALRGRFGGGTLDLVGTLRDGGAPIVLTMSGRDIAARALAPFGMPVDGRATLRLDATRARDGVRVAGRVVVRDGRFIGGGPARLLTVDQRARRALGAATPRLAGVDLPFDELRAAFAWRRGTWRLPRVFMTVGDLVAGGDGRVRQDGVVEGRGTVRLSPALVRELAPFDAVLAPFREPSGAATLPFAVGGSVTAPRFALRTP